MCESGTRTRTHMHTHTYRGSSWEAASSLHHSGRRYFPKRKTPRCNRSRACEDWHDTCTHLLDNCLTSATQTAAHPLRRYRLTSVTPCSGAPSLPGGTHGSCSSWHLNRHSFCLFMCLSVRLLCLFIQALQPEKRSLFKTNVLIYTPGVCLRSRAL